MHQPSTSPNPQNTLEALLSAVAEPLHFEVVSAEWTGSGKYRVLRIFLDNLPRAVEESGQGAEGGIDTKQTETSKLSAPDTKDAQSDAAATGLAPSRSSVTLQDCARLSRLFELRLDAAEGEAEYSTLAGQLKAPYTLEVSSPGIERPLTKVEHFQRFAGHPVSIRCHQAILPQNERKTFNGKLLGIDSAETDAPRVRMHEKDLDQEVGIPLAAIRKAHLVFEGRI